MLENDRNKRARVREKQKKELHENTTMRDKKKHNEQCE